MKIYLSIALLLYGFVAVAQEIKVDSAKANDLRDVVITGQYGPQTLRNSVYHVRTISAERIKLRAATNVQQVLNTELGFRFSNDLTLGTTDIQLMGMTGRNVKILLDGVPMVDRSDTRESLNQIDINTIERIEIVEGPMSVIYGSDALAGVINIITKKPGRELLNLSARIQEETAGNEYEALSGKGNHMQNITANWKNNNWSVLTGFSHNDFGGWNLAAKTATIDEVNAIANRWKPKEQFLGNAKVGYRYNNFNIWYRLDALKEDIDVRYGLNPNNYKGILQTYTTHRYTQQLQSEYKINNSLQLSAIAGFTKLDRATKTVIHNFTNNTEELSTGAGEQDIAKFNAANFRVTAIYTLSQSVSFQPGFEYSRDAASGQRINGSPMINDYAAFLTAALKVSDQISIRPGLRVIKNSVYDAPPVIPSLNTKFILTKKLDLRLAFAKGFRSPALRELYYDFVDASHNILGNPNLKAEESNSFNGSLAWEGVQVRDFQFRSTLSGFYNLFKNRIEFGFDPTNPTITTLINISKYKTTGGTLENTFIFKNLQATLGASYIGRYNDLSENTNLQTPEFAWATELNSNITYTFTKLNGSISLFYKYTGNLPSYQITNNATVKLVKIGAFHTADLMFNKNLLKSLTINAGIKNLFNVTQLTNSSVASGGAHSTSGATVPYSYGRSYLLGLSYSWDKL
ncbi:MULTISPECIES: TonB-dependent receptor plug domain-containing protein [unclassified Pedobacter]|uniref:TonB-dependent receptor plug domain-containing protein n=1 Tax=unclassified Pedobacter TaxID=2628915 RepID=UPI0014244B5E|nr:MULTISPECIES: TonB-dependent receptor [unclassified Pedobacter]NII82778.1 outer membrane receptor for ferrienterochelin and colicins [Pedobacter sp. SG908]NMN36796.1 outer membrane receptor for ferrienterochelin and colicins [Pedobacter sp. SG918]